MPRTRRARRRRARPRRSASLGCGMRPGALRRSYDLRMNHATEPEPFTADDLRELSRLVLERWTAGADRDWHARAGPPGPSTPTRTGELLTEIAGSAGFDPQFRREVVVVRR